jgi:teichuronic acid biosynthesis glycosyltransferase TuaC
LRKRIREGGYDLIHAHYTFSGWVALLASPGKPLVVSYMGSDTYGSVDRNGRTRLKSIPIILQGALLSLLIDGAIVKSANLKRFVLRKQRVEIIPNGVDFETFRTMESTEARRRLGLNPDRDYVLFAGNPKDPRKNHTLAKEAVDKCQTDPPPALLTPYPIPHDQMPLWLNAATVLIQTSWLEGSPNVIKEALACNTPILATPAGDTADLLEGVQSSYICQWDAVELAQQLAVILRDGSRSNGRILRPNLNDRVIAQRIVKLYQETIKRKRG